MCNINVVNRISCCYLIFFLEGIGGDFGHPWLRPAVRRSTRSKPPTIYSPFAFPEHVKCGIYLLVRFINADDRVTQPCS